MFPTKRNLFQPRGLLAEGATQPPPPPAAAVDPNVGDASLPARDAVHARRPTDGNTSEAPRPPCDASPTAGGVTSSSTKKTRDAQENALLSPRKIQFDVAAASSPAAEARIPERGLTSTVPVAPLPNLLTSSKPSSTATTAADAAHGLYQTLVRVLACQVRSQAANILVWVVVFSDPLADGATVEAASAVPSHRPLCRSAASPSPDPFASPCRKQAAQISQLMTDLNRQLSADAGADDGFLPRRCRVALCEVPSSADVKTRARVVDAALREWAAAGRKAHHTTTTDPDTNTSVVAHEDTVALLMTGIETEAHLRLLRDAIRVSAPAVLPQRLGCIVVAPPSTRDSEGGAARDTKKRARSDVVASTSSSTSGRRAVPSRGAGHAAHLGHPHNAHLLSTACFDVLLRILPPGCDQ